MSNFQHPFNDDIKLIKEKLNEITRILKTRRIEKPEYQILDNSDFLELFKITKKTARVWRENGTISYSKISNKYYYRLSDIRKLIDDKHIQIKKK
jgi:hypothetical protein